MITSLQRPHIIAVILIFIRFSWAHAETAMPPESALQRLSSYFRDTISSHSGEINTIEFCPDNTCEVFIGKKTMPLTTVADFTYLYMYFFSDYYVLSEWRRTPGVSHFAKELLSRHAKTICSTGAEPEKARCIIHHLSARGSIKIFDDRYDERARYRHQKDIGEATKP